MKQVEQYAGILAFFALIMQLLFLPGSSMLFVLTSLTLVLIYLIFGFALFNGIGFKRIFRRSTYQQISVYKMVISVSFGIVISVLVAGIALTIFNRSFGKQLLLIGIVVLGLLSVITIVYRQKNKYEDFKIIFSRAVLIGSLGLAFLVIPEIVLVEILHRNHPAFIFAVKELESDPQNDAIKAEVERQSKMMENEHWAFVAIIALIGYSFYRFKERRILEKKQALLEERERISRDMHDDLGASLSSISVFSSAVKQKLLNNETKEAEQLLDRMSNDAQEMVSSMSDMVWTISPHNDTIEKLTERLQVYAVGMLSAKNISFSLECEEELKNKKLPVDIRKNIFLILKEAINNAAKYSDSSEVKLTVYKKENRFVVELTDNGKGFDISAQEIRNGKDGNGLRNMHQRANEIQSQFKIISDLSVGTIVTLVCLIPKIGE